MIKIVFFDVGGTLIQPTPSVGEIYAEVAARHGVVKSSLELNERFQQCWKQKKLEGEKIDEFWWRDLVFRVFDARLFLNTNQFFTDLYQTFTEPSAWKVFNDVAPTLRQLKNRGLRLAVASNWDDRLPALLERLNLSESFERQFVSSQLGVMKPDPKFFLTALKQMGGNAVEAIHVGDDPIEDVRCAEAAGMRAYVIDRKSRPLNSRMLSSLEEVILRV